MGLRTTSSAPTYRLGSHRSLPNVATATVRVPSGLAAWPCAETAVIRQRAATTIGAIQRRGFMTSSQPEG